MLFVLNCLGHIDQGIKYPARSKALAWPNIPKSGSNYTYRRLHCETGMAGHQLGFHSLFCCGPVVSYGTRNVGRHWFRKWKGAYLNQCWLIVNMTPMNKFKLICCTLLVPLAERWLMLIWRFVIASVNVIFVLFSYQMGSRVYFHEEEFYHFFCLYVNFIR